MIRWATNLVAVGALGTAIAVTTPAISGAPKAASSPTGDEEAGREYYAEDCRACHSGAIAPSLRGISTRGIAAVPGYSYSAGLKKKAGKAWTASELDAFLAHPTVYAEGSKMMVKVEDPQKRADIISYIKTL